MGGSEWAALSLSSEEQQWIHDGEQRKWDLLDVQSVLDEDLAPLQVDEQEQENLIHAQLVSELGDG